MDPLAAEYPHNSPYAFSENRVIDSRELEGLERIHFTRVAGEGGNTVALVKTHEEDIEDWSIDWVNFRVVWTVNSRQEYVVHQTDRTFMDRGPYGMGFEEYEESVTFDSYEEALNSTDSDFNGTWADWGMRFQRGLEAMAEEHRGGAVLGRRIQPGRLYANGGGGGRVWGKVRLGSSDLSKMTMRARSSYRNPNTTRNFATIEYRDLDGNIQTKSFVSSGTGRPEGYTEALIQDFFSANNIPSSNLMRLHTELIPCSNCTPILMEMDARRVS